MMKKIFLVLLAMLLMFTLIACDEEEEVEIQKYTVTFVDSNGNTVATETVYNEEISLPDAPKIKGYQFIGWYLESDEPVTELSENYFVNNPATADVTAYACYVESPEFTVTPSSINGCAITGIIGSMKNVVIPEKVTIVVGDEAKEYVVEAIYDNAFRNNKSIESVVIPNTVKQIGAYAFENCTNLKELTVPTTVGADSVGEGILNNTTSLTKITAPIWVVEYADSGILVDVVFNVGQVVGAGMFENATNLKSVQLPADLETIEAAAFKGATALTAIHIPASVTSIAHDAFAYCSALNSMSVDAANANYESNNSNCIVEIENGQNGSIETLIAGCANTVIYEGIEVIGEYAFLGCSRLTALNVPSTVTEIHEGAFYGCTALASINVSEANGKYASVNNCLIIPQSMRLVQGCKNSKIEESYEIGGETLQLVSISSEAFKGCSGLTEIYIPSTIASLEADSFNSCASLVKIVVANEELVLDGDVFSNCTKINNIKVPMALLDYFIEKSFSTLANVELTTGEAIDDYLFADCTSLKNIILPATVTEIGAGAFSGCNQLTGVAVAEDSALAVIGHNAFSGCSKFKGISVVGETITGFVVPATVSFIGDYAFEGCAITALDFAEDGVLARIGYKVFADCTSLTTVTIPSYIDTVDFDAFNGCSQLSTVKIPAELVRALANAKTQNGTSAIKTLEITSGALVDCYYIREMSNLESLIIGATVEYVDNRAFEGCSKLNNITVSDENATYVSIGNCLVEKATGTLVLGTVNAEIGADVKIISSYAFACSNIAKIAIPANVELIESFAFSSCRSLAEITIESSATVIENAAFDGCDGVEKATIPANAIAYISQASLREVEITEGEIPAYAFKDCVTLVKVVVSPEVDVVGESAFGGCTGITSITAPSAILAGFSELTLDYLGINAINGPITKEFIDNFSNITKLELLASDEPYEIDDDAFASCTSIVYANIPAWAINKIPTENIQELVINSGSSVTGVARFPALEKVTFAASVTDVDAAVFSNSDKLAEIVVGDENTKYDVINGCLMDGTVLVLAANEFVIPEGVTEIGAYAFAGRSAVTNVTLPEGITDIGNHAFNGCTSLVIDALPSTLVSIGNYAFKNCESLESLIIPDGVASIGNGAFAGCVAVTEIKLPADIAVENVGYGILSGCNSITSASVPVFAINLLPASNIEVLAIISGEELAQSSIAGFVSLKSLTVGATVKNISSLAIVGENKLESITVDEANENYYSEGNCIISADKHLVMGCSYSVIPEGVEYIDANSFINCVDLTDVVIPASVKEISTDAFAGCYNIVSITVAEGNSVYYSENNCVITTEDNVLVLGCKTSTIPEGVTAIGDYAFYNVSDLVEVILPESVVKIGEYAFANTGITEIRIPTSVTEIADHAFYCCGALETVIVLENSSLESIGASAFSDCSKLSLIVIPNTVVSIGENALNNKASGIKIYWYGTAEEYTASAISGELALGNVYYFSAKNNPGHWYYKDGGLNVAVW